MISRFQDLEISAQDWENSNLDFARFFCSISRDFGDENDQTEGKNPSDPSLDKSFEDEQLDDYFEWILIFLQILLVEPRYTRNMSKFLVICTAFAIATPLTPKSLPYDNLARSRRDYTSISTQSRSREIVQNPNLVKPYPQVEIRLSLRPSCHDQTQIAASGHQVMTRLSLRPSCGLFHDRRARPCIHLASYS